MREHATLNAFAHDLCSNEQTYNLYELAKPNFLEIYTFAKDFFSINLSANQRN